MFTNYNSNFTVSNVSQCSATDLNSSITGTNTDGGSSCWLWWLWEHPLVLFPAVFVCGCCKFIITHHALYHSYFHFLLKSEDKYSFNPRGLKFTNKKQQRKKPFCPSLKKHDWLTSVLIWISADVPIGSLFAHVKQHEINHLPGLKSQKELVEEEEKSLLLKHELSHEVDEISNESNLHFLFPGPRSGSSFWRLRWTNM